MQLVQTCQELNAVISPLTSPQSHDQMKARVSLDIVVRQGVSVFKLLARKDESLLVVRDAFLVLYHFLELTDGG